jgi:hypothetical protein
LPARQQNPERADADWRRATSWSRAACGRAGSTVARRG